MTSPSGYLPGYLSRILGDKERPSTYLLGLRTANVESDFGLSTRSPVICLMSDKEENVITRHTRVRNDCLRSRRFGCVFYCRLFVNSVTKVVCESLRDFSGNRHIMEQRRIS